MSSWPLRRKLIALVSIPMLVLLATGVFLGFQTALSYRSAVEVKTLATLASSTVDVQITLRAERAASVDFVRGTDGAQAKVDATRTESDRAVAALRAGLADAPGGGWPGRTLPAQLTAATSLDRLADVRSGVTVGRTAVDVSGRYDPLLSSVDALMSAVVNDLEGETANSAAANHATTLGALAAVATAASTERFELYEALSVPKVTAEQNKALVALAARQDQQFTTAATHADAQEKQRVGVISDDDERLGRFRADVQTAADSSEKPTADPGEFDALAAKRINALDDLSRDVAASTVDSAGTDVRDALLQVGLVALLVVLTMAAVTTVLVTIARSVTAPLRRLWTGAIDIASVQLPAAVQRIERDGANADVSLPPVLPAGAAAGPETLEVARAVDDLGAEAVRLATAQVRLRRALDEAFVSMSRRSQSMVEKQLTIIDELERTEQDPDQLRNLFRLDHLAARMRRYNDNLLVLAGSAVRTRTTSPVKVAELFRAATSEMEHYERVRLQPVNGASVAGTVAGELIHLVAELLDNAAMYSPPTSPIVLTATVTPQGGLQFEIVDSGVGISPGELDRLNARLARPEGIDTQVPSRMGLFVVARLAQRGGFSVSLRPRPDANGTVAQVNVPPALVLGTAGRTGEQPILSAAMAARRTAGAHTPPAGIPARAVPPRGAPVPAEFGSGITVTRPTAPGPSPVPSSPSPVPAGANPPTSRQPSTRVTTEAFSEAPDSTPLPRRTRGSNAAPGMPASALGDPRSTGAMPWSMASGSDLVPLGGPSLFTPVVEPEPDEQSETPDAGANGSASDDPASAASATGAGAPTRADARQGAERPPAARPGAAASGAARGGVAVSGASSLYSPARPDTPHTSPTGIPLSPLAPAAGTSGLNAWGTAARAAYQARLDAEATAARTSSPAAPEPTVEPVPAPADPAGSPAAGQTELPTRSSTRGATPSGTGWAPPSEGSGLPQRIPGDATGFAGLANTSMPNRPLAGSPAPAAWDPSLAADLATRRSTSFSTPPPPPPPTDTSAPVSRAESLSRRQSRATGTGSRSHLIGSYDATDQAHDGDTTPIFDSISVWFDSDAEPTGGQDQVIDLRDDQPPTRWSALGDQRWLAANARAAAAPETAGTTEVGLPRRRPGANLLPSTAGSGSAPAAARTPVPSPAAPRVPNAPTPVDRDADLVRGRLGSYQRGLATARQARNGGRDQTAPAPVGASLFTATRDSDGDARQQADQGGNQ